MAGPVMGQPKNDRARFAGGIAALLLIGVLGASFVVVAADARGNSARTGQKADSLWVRDLDVFSEELPKRHENLFFKISQESFSAHVDRLRGEVPDLEPYEILARIMEIISLVGDSHTMLSAEYTGLFGKLPVLTQWYSDGLFVRTTVPEYRETLGKRVTAIGGKSVGEVVGQMRRVVPHENEPQLKNRAPTYMMFPEVLAALGVTDSPDSAVFSIESIGDVSFHPRSSMSVFRWISVLDSVECEIPLYLQNPDSSYWFTHIEDAGAVYVQYRQCSEMKARPFGQFTAEVLESAGAEDVDKLIIDMRLNGGGNSTVARPLIDGIKGLSNINRKGHLFVIVGRETYSSAILNALELKNETNAVFAGEPTGGKPNHYGEVKFFPLPNCKAIITYSTKYFAYSTDDSPSFVPDIEVELSSLDFMSCRDPVLEVILDYE